jgi:hypothetical protein
MRLHKPFMSRVAAVVVLSASMALTPVAALAESNGDEYDPRGPSPEAMAFDAVLVRPVSFVGAVLSTAVFVVSLPFSAPGGNASQAAETLVADPWRYTFARPLGAGFV